jgi:tetratricopeptide (TPR) repeat protein
MKPKPTDSQALYDLGAVSSRAGDLSGAAAHFARAISLRSDYFEAHRDLATTCIALGRFPRAFSHCRQALRLNPKAQDAWLVLGRIFSDGRNEVAWEQAARLEAGLVDAWLASATRICASQATGTCGEPDEPLATSGTAVFEMCTGLALVLLYRGRLDEALWACEQALRLRPGDPVVLAGQAGILERQGKVEEAYQRVRVVLDQGTVNLGAAEVYTRICRQAGDCDEAIAVCRWLLGRTGLSKGKRQLLHFALGKLYDKLGAYDDAFREYERANGLSDFAFNPGRRAERVDALIAGFAPESLERMPRPSLRSERPVFIVGMPRSGTSLVEQILASHPRVFGAGELNDINELVRSLPASVYPGRMAAIGQGTVDELAGRYLDRLASLADDAWRVTDKMPANFQNLGFIAVLLPGARVIHCMREPLDTCLSIYFQNFGTAHPYASDLGNIGAFYRQYERLMAHWREVLDIPIFEVSYRELVLDQERVSRELIDFCGLEWDARCLRFHQTARAVATASYDQVRRPIYQSSLQRWMNYERYIGPLKEALGLQE